MHRQETFSGRGRANIFHLSADLLPSSLFYPRVRNDGVTSHFKAISSILTGNWQRVDDWETLHQSLRAPPNRSSGKRSLDGGEQQGTDESDRCDQFGNLRLTLWRQRGFPESPPAHGGRSHQGNLADRDKTEAEIESVIQGSDYEGLGWNVFGKAHQLDRGVEAPVRNAIDRFVHTNAPPQ
jgi:hypothetical protein